MWIIIDMSDLYYFQITDTHGIVHCVEANSYHLEYSIDDNFSMWVWLGNNIKAVYLNVTGFQVEEIEHTSHSPKGLNANPTEDEIDDGRQE